mgnify:CR=1 FL=1
MQPDFFFTKGGVWDTFFREAARRPDPICIATYNMAVDMRSKLGAILHKLSLRRPINILLGIPELVPARHALYSRVESFPNINWRFHTASHMKLAVCGPVGFTGSINLNQGDWNEVAVGLTPPQCAQAQKVFDNFWKSTANLTMDQFHELLFAGQYKVDLKSLLEKTIPHPFNLKGSHRA